MMLKKFFLLLLILVLSFSTTSWVYANNFPVRPIEIVIPFGEGGASDIFARKFAEIMNKDMPVPFQPVNKPGGGGLVGMVYAYSQKNDGYTVLEITPSHVIADVMERSEVKLLQHFEPICRIQSDIYVISVNKNSDFETFEELVKYGQEKEVTFAGISPGGIDDFTLRALAKATGIKLKFVPYKSGSEVKAAVLGGEVDIYLDKIISAIGYIEDGSVRPLVILNDKRIEKLTVFKNVPTTVELGYEVTMGSWRGFVVKKGTPEHAKTFLAEKMKKAYDSKEYQKFADDNLVNIRPGYLDSEDFEKFLHEQYNFLNEIALETGLK
ncbi:MAG: putative tricarboxylic transport rane protein [Synergistales bacterium]|nr:putative tricarboxylic transport rane protein [Synergistales bacterium]